MFDNVRICTNAMGCAQSKPHQRQIKSEKVLTMNECDDNITVNSAIRYDEEIIKILRMDLDETPQIFVLNNLLLSIMFFENYKKEMHSLFHSTGTRMEKELNPKLLRDETIECIVPDMLFEQVNKNIRFRPIHGPKKLTAEPLVPKRIYIVNDNIEVFDLMDTPHYSVIDKPGYQARMEDSKHSGFVKLRLLEPPKQLKKQQITVTIEPQPGPSSQSDDSSDYYYTTITEIKTPKPLEIIACERRDTLPETCFATRKIRKVPTYNGDAELIVPQTEDDLFQTVSYISSDGFMAHFQNAIFPNSLGKSLGFDQDKIELAKAMPGTIFCSLLDDDTDDNMMPCEIIPSVGINWPGMQAFEFEMREERPTITDKRTRYRYRWPTDEMIKFMKTCTCTLVPKGFYMKRSKEQDDDHEIQWEIHFPKAERYIETRMSHAQIRCYLCLLTIYKTYIEPVTAKYGLLVEHIRCHMYWECESNFRDWPEHRLGIKLLKVIQNLNVRLAKAQLPDYFIKKKNLFANIPKKCLLYAHKVFHNVLESPVMYFMGALRNLRYTSSKFYPTFNFQEFYKILISDSSKLINSNLGNEIGRGIPIYRRKRYEDPDLVWQKSKEAIIKEKIIRKRIRDKQKEIEKNLDEKRKNSVDSINYDWNCDNGFDIFKTRLILMLFIEHYIGIAKKSIKLSTREQCLFYLKQAYYLTKLLEENDGCLLDARQLLEIIQKEEETCKKAFMNDVVSELPPSTPVRNSVQMTWDVTQQVKNNSINLNNLNKSYHGTQTVLNKVSSFKKSALKTDDVTASEMRKSVVFMD